MVIPGNFVFNIARTLHERGINVRYMGKIFKHCTSVPARALLLIEMAARVIKQTLRKKIREKMSELKFPPEHPYIELLVTYLNVIIFGKKINQEEKEIPQNTEAWKIIESTILEYFELKNEIETSEYLKPFAQPLQIREIIWTFNVPGENQNQVHHGPILLFDRIRQSMGFKIMKSYLNRIYGGFVSQLKTLAITGIGQKVKHMNIISHAEGWLLRHDDPEIALQKFDIARDSLPLNKYTLRNYASLTVDSEQKKHQGQKLTERAFIQYVKYLYNLALEEDPKDTHTLYQYGHFLNLIGNYQKAEEHLIQAIQAHPGHKEAWLELLKCFLNSKQENLHNKYRSIVQAKFE